MENDVPGRLVQSHHIRKESPHLFNLIISREQFRARLIEDPVRLTNGDIRISLQQLADIQNICNEE
jgi:hypothetical protein